LVWKRKRSSNGLKPWIERVKTPKGAVLLIGFLVMALAPPFIKNDFYLDAFILIFLWGAFAASWNIISGYAGMVSLAHNAFFAIGAYTSTLLFVRFNITPWLGLMAGGVLAALVGLILGLVCFRLRSHYFTLATLAFGEVISIVALNWRSLTNGAIGIGLPIEPNLYNMVFQGKLPYLYIGLVLFVGVTALSYAIEQSRLGYQLTAFRENEDAARALGVRTGRVRLMAMGISCFLAAVAGSVYAQYISYIDPSSVARLQISVQVALFVIVGGIGTAIGPAIGAIIFIPITMGLRAFLGSSMPGLHLIIYAVILIMVLFFMPKGVYGTLQERFAGMNRRGPAS
jgi:branched-chain amino acid transport system permease protein